MNKISVEKSYAREEAVHGLERLEKPKKCNGTRVRTLRSLCDVTSGGITGVVAGLPSCSALK